MRASARGDYAFFLWRLDRVVTRMRQVGESVTAFLQLAPRQEPRQE